MKSLFLKSPAKINLFLSIIRRLPNGYHELATLFHRISLADTLKFKKIKSGFELKTNHPFLEVDERNLMTKAWRLLQAKKINLDGLEVFLEKNIPLGSGLGGGSSNAAFFLLGVNQLFNLRISKKELIKMGSQLGADVPFFMLNRKTAAGFSRGDKLSTISLKRKLWFVLFLSSKPLSTKAVYEALPRELPPVLLSREKKNINNLVKYLENKKWSEVEKKWENHLEKPALSLRPDILKIMMECRKLGAKNVRMSGSGPTVFALFSDSQSAKKFVQKIKPRLPSKSWNPVICHSA